MLHQFIFQFLPLLPRLYLGLHCLENQDSIQEVFVFIQGNSFEFFCLFYSSHFYLQFCHQILSSSSFTLFDNADIIFCCSSSYRSTKVPSNPRIANSTSPRYRPSKSGNMQQMSFYSKLSSTNFSQNGTYRNHIPGHSDYQKKHFREKYPDHQQEKKLPISN